MAEITKADVISFIEKMSVLELAEMVKELEEKFGVSAAAPVAVAAVAGPAAAEAAEEKTEFDVILKLPAPTRSVSSRLFVHSPAWASKKPKTWLTVHPSRSKPAFPRKKPKRPRSNWLKLAQKWKLNKNCCSDSCSSQGRHVRPWLFYFSLAATQAGCLGRRASKNPQG